MSQECPICGCMNLNKETGTFSFKLPEKIGAGSIEISNSEWFKCSECKEIILPPRLQRDLENERYRLLGLLMPDEIREIRMKAGLTQQEIATILGVGEKTYTRWEAGRSLQSKSSDTLIRLFSKNPDMFMEVSAERSPDRNDKIADYFKSIYQIKGQNEYGLAAYGHVGDLDNELILKIRKKIQGAASGS